MLNWLRRIGLLLAWCGVLVWTIGLTVLQPLTEPAKPWYDEVAENNTYWARDVRLMAILVILAGIVIACRGDRRIAAWAALGAVGWLGVDVWLDRLDVAGAVATIGLAVAGSVVVGLAGLLTTRTNEPSRHVLIATAIAAAVVAPAASGITGPTETDPAGLTVTALSLGVLMTAVALCSAVLALRAIEPARVAALLALSVAAVGSVVCNRAQLGVHWSVYVALSLALVIAVVGLAGNWPGSLQARWRYVVLAGVIIAVSPILLIVALIFTFLPFGDLLTALAGNPAVHDADTDSLTALAVLIPGLLLGAAAAFGDRISLTQADLEAELRQREPAQ